MGDERLILPGGRASVENQVYFARGGLEDFLGRIDA